MANSLILGRFHPGVDELSMQCRSPGAQLGPVQQMAVDSARGAILKLVLGNVLGPVLGAPAMLALALSLAPGLAKQPCPVRQTCRGSTDEFSRLTTRNAPLLGPRAGRDERRAAGQQQKAPHLGKLVAPGSRRQWTQF
mmetsp:Transcript_121292/g.209588  ORF Transcript_121292/g.209588 Transcript_121292/m.209588 type:complete len:138 (+) Transcript_121292:33-446(+)